MEDARRLPDKSSGQTWVRLIESHHSNINIEFFIEYITWPRTSKLSRFSDDFIIPNENFAWFEFRNLTNKPSWLSEFKW